MSRKRSAAAAALIPAAVTIRSHSQNTNRTRSVEASSSVAADAHAVVEPIPEPIRSSSAAAITATAFTPGASVRSSSGSNSMAPSSFVSSHNNKNDSNSPPSSSNSGQHEGYDLKAQFLEVLAARSNNNGTTTGTGTGVSNTELKALFGETLYPQLVPIMNELLTSHRLRMSQSSTSSGSSGGNGVELSYHLVSEETAAQLSGLDVTAQMVYQVIEKASTSGIWTKDIRIQTNIPQQALTKILKILEQRHLIKPVKSVTQKAKKLYMLYDLTPSAHITGGVWYSEHDHEFDHSFIRELREFILQLLRRLNGGKGCTVQEIQEKLILTNVSRVELTLHHVHQLLQTLVYDYAIEEQVVAVGADGAGGGGDGKVGSSDVVSLSTPHPSLSLSSSSILSSTTAAVRAKAAASGKFIASTSDASSCEPPGSSHFVVKYQISKRLSGLCEFSWWECLDQDFHFRAIEFEDGIVLAPHEPHYHT